MAATASIMSSGSSRAGRPACTTSPSSSSNSTSICASATFSTSSTAQILWGPGRHRPGDNTYAYYTDASGMMIECSGVMAQIADDADFTANVITNLERPGNVRAMNVWGTPAPLEWREYFHPFAQIA
ncbi:hypothetical protein ABIA22_000664 [Sinorhizobium fredii]|uniref:hypothetical protein n=1 Tax=Rhizobium fredii TaxID=380 RepID=UPI0035113EF5